MGSRGMGAALALALLWAGSAQAGQVEMIREDALREGPSPTAREIGKAPKGARAEELAKSGGWRQIRSAGKTGWVRLLSAKQVGGSAGGSLAGISGNYDAKRVVAVAGLRGLSEEELKAAKFDAEQLGRLESLGVSAAEAEGFARAGGLERMRAERLPDPAKEERARAESAARSGSGGWGEETLWGN